MSFTRKWRTRASVLACAGTSCLLALACSASVEAASVLPAEEGWQAGRGGRQPHGPVPRGLPHHGFQLVR